GTWIAAQGSRAAPTLPERRARVIAAGALSVPLRPRNSVRSPLMVRDISSTSKKAVRSVNSVLYGFRPKSAPVLGSISVITCMHEFGLRSPRTHSAYPVAESRRDLSDSFLTFNTDNLTDASIAT